MIFPLLGLVLAVTPGTAPASPQSGPASSGNGVVDAIASCRSVADDGQRLACFDAAAKALSDARAAKTIVVMDQAEVRKAKRSMFGFSLPSIKLFGAGDDDEALKTLTATMQATSALPGGLSRFQLDDGSVWTTTEQINMSPKRGDVVTIKAGALGSYVATAPGRRAVRVVRAR